MANNIQKLKTEIDTDPLARGYAGMTDFQVANDLNTVYRDAEGGVLGMLNYLIKNRSRTNNGTDTVATAILGRIHAVANTTVGADTFGDGTSHTMEHIHNANAMLIMLSSPQISTMDFVDTEFEAMLSSLAGGAGGAKCMKPADVTAIKALSQNQQSRDQELGIGKTREGDVAKARAI